HDLRHTFAVHRLLRWYRDGVDVQSRLLLLSGFMGHVNVHATQVYLTVTGDLLREANDRFQRHVAAVIGGEGGRGPTPRPWPRTCAPSSRTTSPASGTRRPTRSGVTGTR